MKRKCLANPIAFSGEMTDFVVGGRAVDVIYFDGYSMGCNKVLGARLGIFPTSLIIEVMPSSFGLGSSVPLD